MPVEQEDIDAVAQPSQDAGASPPANGLASILLREVLGETHHYAHGIEQDRPTTVSRAESARRLLALGRERIRDLVERGAARLGFSRSHFDPSVAGERLERVLSLSGGLEATFAQLADDASRRALIDLLKLRVLGPHHAQLAVTPAAYRAKQRYADRELRERHGTFEVSDPWFSPLSLYRVPVEGASPVRLHSHSVDIVSVFLLNQYTYASGSRRVGAEPGDVVLDVGGCWGDTALYFASLVGPKGKVYTFEFDPESLEVLRANLALNPELAGRIEVVEQALWDESGRSLGFVQAGRMTSIVDGDAEKATLRVPTITVDDFIAQAGIDRLGLIKLDVEGAELNVLRGAGDSLKRFAPRLAIAAYHRDDDLVRIPEAIDSLSMDQRLYLATSSAVEEETVLFATLA